MKASKLTKDTPRSSLARLVRHRCDRRETTAWILHATASGSQGRDVAQWLRLTPPSAKLLDNEMSFHPHGTRFWLRRDRRTSWQEWEATPNGALSGEGEEDRRPMKRKDPAALALGKKAKDKPKKMTPEALAQRLRNCAEMNRKRALSNSLKTATPRSRTIARAMI